VAKEVRCGDVIAGCPTVIEGKDDKEVMAKAAIVPHYMGNSTFRSLGNILENPQIGMLFIELPGGLRMRVNGEAEISDDPDGVALFPGSVETVKVTVHEVYRQNRPAVEVVDRPAPSESRRCAVPNRAPETIGRFGLAG
jgi:hypothetical protein